VDAGEIIGLLGPNGAGKTTMMKIMAGYLQPDAGKVTIDGLDVLTDTLAVQERIGYLPENAPLYPEMSVQAYLRMMADLRQIPADDQPLLLSQAVRAAGLASHLTRPIAHLSKGYRQRVGLAQAILHKPKLLILDEPTVGLDPTQIVEVRRLIRRLARQTTVLLSTHILSEVEATCDRVIILLNGHVRADARLSALATTMNIVLVLDKEAPNVARELRHVPGVDRVELFHTNDGQGYRIHGQDGADLRPAVYALVRDNNWGLRELRRDVRTLEMVFNELATAEMVNSEPVAVAGGVER
jgi:ABC-2 type transport system ATP-binding protein